jgi:hypothetical protein
MQLLRKKPTDRLALEKVLQHPFIMRHNTAQQLAVGAGGVGAQMIVAPGLGGSSFSSGAGAGAGSGSGSGSAQEASALASMAAGSAPAAGAGAGSSSSSASASAPSIAQMALLAATRPLQQHLATLAGQRAAPAAAKAAAVPASAAAASSSGPVPMQIDP